jgi:deazaflavin-dependent oxidoreductase (nitroreductase family)
MDVKVVNRRVIEQFRAGGEIDGMRRERIVLLTTVGARSGERRTTPMMFHRDGERLLVIASNIGAPKHPDWYVNLAKNPRVTVEVGDETYEAKATTAVGAERERLWAVIKENYPFFADHERKTSREIPVVVLSRYGRVLVIGLDPAKLEGWDPEPVQAAIARGHARFGELGIEADMCLVAPDENPEATVVAALTGSDYACVVVGGGIRKHEPYLELFEKVVNLVRQHAPDAAIAFNNTPDDTADAALRWL